MGSSPIQAAELESKMIVVTEKREIVGTLKTLVGTFPLLHSQIKNQGNGTFIANVVDEEGFENYLLLHGDFVAIPVIVHSLVDVKRVLTKEEAQGVEILTADTID